MNAKNTGVCEGRIKNDCKRRDCRHYRRHQLKIGEKVIKKCILGSECIINGKIRKVRCI